MKWYFSGELKVEKELARCLGEVVREDWFTLVNSKF